jgi:GDSL-like Lipase/Acylhydrolase family
MRLPRLVTALICATTLSGGSLALAATASAASVHYVALGDSYSSGDGAGSYSDGDCLQSANAYPELWANAHAPASFTNETCAGAVTSDVLNGQLSGVTSATTLVSVTIGGNDVGFSSVMETCVLDSDSSCLSAVAAAESYAQNTLPGALNNLFAAIHSKAPSAHVVVLDYPHLYTITSFCIGLSNTKRTALNAGADTLDTTISKAAATAGFTFADVRSQFSGHELCSGDGWLHSVTIPIDESYHPTQTGQSSGYLPVFTSHAS